MRFEHLVRVNDPLNPLLDALTRAQLWRGLMLRAEQPTQFVFGLMGFVIRSRAPATATDSAWLARTLDFGNFQVHDRVLLTDGEQTLTATEAGSSWPASRLCIRIEGPAEPLLALRFVYEFDSAEPADPPIEALRRQAYRQADIDTVGRIRELARLGELR